MAKAEGPGGLFEDFTSFENLYRAAAQSRRGKRFKEATARFEHDLARNLLRLRDELRNGSYRPGPYRTFTIFEPAKRFISAAPYRDRVVHHALCNAIEPLFERSFIFDSYANRRGKGTHRALDRASLYARKYRYVLQCDIRLFFPSIDHQILMTRLARRIRDGRVLSVARLILESSNPQPAAEFYFPGDDLFTPFERRKGLPIGNLTSQFWANVYLDTLDHFVKDGLGVKGYVRYVDDFLLFANDKRVLARWLASVERKLEESRLLLHERKSKIYPVSEGIPFLGFRVFPTHRRLLPRAVARARVRLCRMQEQCAAGEIELGEVAQSVRAWIAHASNGSTLGLRRHLLGGAGFRAGGLFRGSRRRVEQQSEQRRVCVPQQQPPDQP